MDLITFSEFKRRYEAKQVEEVPNRIESNPLVSVCVTTYNQAKYINDCLDGILIQKTKFPFEILLGEDASNDGTREICAGYAQRYPDKIRLFLHYRENNIKIDGKATGRFNFLYNLFSARGKYIALCEGDDYWTDPLKLQKQVDFLQNNMDCSLCFHPSRLIYMNGQYSDRIEEPYSGHYQSGYKFSAQEVISGGLGIWTASMVFNRNVIKQLPNWFCNVVYGDIALRLLCAKTGKVGYLAGRPMSIYRRGTEGGWSADEGKSREWEYKRFEDHLDVLDYFNESTHGRYSREIYLQKRKRTIVFLIVIQDKLNMIRSAKLILSNIALVLSFYPKSSILVITRFLLGSRVYKRVVKSERIKKIMSPGRSA